MDHWKLFALARPVARAVVMMATTSIIAALAAPAAFAQQQPAKPPAAPATAPAPATQAKPPQAAQPAQPGQTQPDQQQQQQQDAATQMPQLMYSEWVKFCVNPEQETDSAGNPASKDPKDKSKQVCLTGTDGRLESGQPIIAVVAIEPTAEPQKILRITLPVGMHLQYGTRLIIDQDEPLTAPYVTCFANGCISDYDLKPEILNKLKKGKKVVIQGINFDGSAISVPVPLTQFAKVHDGPPSDLNVLAERQKKLDEGLKKKGEELKRQATEAQQKLERSQQGQTPAKPQ